MFGRAIRSVLVLRRMRKEIGRSVGVSRSCLGSGGLRLLREALSVGLKHSARR